MDLFEKLRMYRRIFGNRRGIALLFRAGFTRSAVEIAEVPPRATQPVYLRMKTSDFCTYEKVFFEEDYGFAVKGEPQVIVDAGANIGLAAVYFANKYPQAKIVAIEPERSNFELLKRNTAGYPKIAARRCALWKENGTVDLIDPGIGHWGFQASATPNQAPIVEKVPAVTLDTLMQEEGIDFIDILKVDIEGGEKELFSSPERWIDRVGAIMIELHDRVKPGCSQSFYAATEDFAHENRKGENIFRARGQYGPVSSRPSVREPLPIKS
jgi:FkbM family methyltransferase